MKLTLTKLNINGFMQEAINESGVELKNTPQVQNDVTLEMSVREAKELADILGVPIEKIVKFFSKF